MKVYDKIFPPKTIQLENGKSIQETRSRTPIILFVLLVAILVSAKITGFNLSTLIARGKQFFVIIEQMFPPKWDYVQQIWEPLFDTIKMSLLGSELDQLL